MDLPAAPPLCFNSLRPRNAATLVTEGALPKSLAQRPRILHLMADELTPNTVAEQAQASASMILKWRQRCQEAGLEGFSS